MGQNPLAVLIPIATLAIAGILLLTRKKKKEQVEDNGAFIERFELLPPPPPPPPSAPLPLNGLEFAVKDIFDIEGHVTGFGNPDWKATHGPASKTATVVQNLVEAGAKCVGKTHMDELAYSINGENQHYGTPQNPTSSGLVPGGSSSGSAVAVAAGIVDFALGTDTGGSVRIPAAYCGVLGFRPSHGVVSISGVCPMAPSLDTVGWFARSPKVLRTAGHAILQQPFVNGRPPSRVLIADDLFDLSTVPRQPVIDAVAATTRKLVGLGVEHVNVGRHLAAHMPTLQKFYSSNGGKEEDENKAGQRALTALRDALRALQGYEFKMGYAGWLEETKPKLAADIAGRVRTALACDAGQASMAQKIREEARSAVNSLLAGDAILVLPTAPGLPPKVGTRAAHLDDFRARAFLLLSVAGMSGCPQVSIPAGNVNGGGGGGGGTSAAGEGPQLSVSLMARHGADRMLLDITTHYAPLVLQEAQQALAAARKKPAAKAAPSAAEKSRQSGAELAKEKGNAAFKSKDFNAAVTHYTKAIQLDGKSAAYYNNRAQAYIKLCKFNEAEDDCTIALKLDKKNVKAMLRRGTSREFLGLYKEAMEDFGNALVYEPTNKQAQEALQRLKALGRL